MQATAAYPQLVLHFDVNKTIILKDTSKGIDDEGMICSLLAEFTTGVWDEEHGPMSYKEYVNQVLIPDNPSDKNIKAKRQQEIAKFLERLDRMHHPLKDEVLRQQQAMRERFLDPKTGQLRFSVFQSFFELVRYLSERNIHFVVVLRTFGNDLKEVIEEINCHPIGMNISRTGKFKNKELHMDGAGTISKVEAIFDTFLHSQEHFGVQDNWKEWNDDGGRARSGKPFIYDASGSWHGVSNLSLFFDDNYTGEEMDIVNPIALNDEPKSPNEPRGKMIFTVNPISAVLEDDYYIQLVKRALQQSI